MWQFFNGWRRKIGLATLMLAVTFMGLWMRSRFGHDLIAFGTGFSDRQHVIAAADDEIGWFSWELEQGEKGGDACFLGVSPQSMEVIEAINRERQRHSFRAFVIPCWQLTLAPTLLSVYLLWPRRKRSPATH